MIETGNEIGPLGEVFITLSTLGLLSFGLAFACDPSIVARLITKRWRPTFESLLKDSNEEREAEELLGAIPHGKEGLVAGAINSEMARYNPNKRRNFDGSRVGKPHQIMLNVLRRVSGAIDRLH